MSFLEVEHAGEQYSLTVKDTTLHLAPISGSLGSLPSSLDIPSIAFAILASNSNSDELTSLTIVHLSSPSDSSALPAVHSIALTSQHDASSFTSHPALGALFLPPAAQYATLHLIINPAAGARTASAYHAQVVAPLLELAGVKAEVHETKAVDDAGVIAREIVKQAKGEKVVLGLLGGDGTTHEALNGLLLGEDERGQLSKPPGDVEVVIVPLGTANALYYHLFPPESPSTPTASPCSSLYSLLAFLRGKVTPQPLPVALNVAIPASPSSPSQTTITSVVTSAALHACLLHDAEELRESMPGVERFKVAAQKNVTSWWEGKLTMRGGVQRYDPESRGLVEFEQVQGQKGVAVEVEEDQVTLQGPFAYLVSSLVSRFEPTFVVAPLRSPLSPLAPGEKGSIDVVLIRPLREGETAKLVAEGGDQVQQAKEGFVGKVWEVTGGMYDGGTHVDVRYPGGDTVVEYFRCVAFEWEPTPSDDFKANLVCLDGALRDLSRGGRLTTKALGAETTGLHVWA